MLGQVIVNTNAYLFINSYFLSTMEGDCIDLAHYRSETRKVAHTVTVEPLFLFYSIPGYTLEKLLQMAKAAGSGGLLNKKPFPDPALLCLGPGYYLSLHSL